MLWQSVLPYTEMKLEVPKKLLGKKELIVQNWFSSVKMALSQSKIQIIITTPVNSLQMQHQGVLKMHVKCILDH